jgi:hypothetical protein
MLWIGAAIVIAGAAIAFALGVFNEAKEGVPDVPAAPQG